MLVLMLIMLFSGILNAKVVIGKVDSGVHKYIVYIGSGNGIYVKNGSTGFANVCSTGLISKNKYVLTRSGKALYGKNEVLTYIRRLFYLGKIKGCK